MTVEAVNYASYLQIAPLFAYQKPVSDDHDEMLFIVIHQVYELWFKQVIWEMDLLRPELEAGNAALVMHTFRRILAIFKTRWPRWTCWRR